MRRSHSGLIRIKPRLSVTKNFVLLSTRTPALANLLERAVRNPAMRFVFVDDELQRLGLRPQLQRIKCPTLIIGGEDDPITPIEDSADIASAMRPGLVQLVKFAKAGHGVYRDRPEDFFRCLASFVES